MKKVLIINFHELCRNNCTHKKLKQIYTFDTDKYITILDFIKKKKVSVISLHDLTTNSVKENLSIALTFDDGNASDFSVAYPILESHGFPAAFFLTVNQINENQITWDNVIEMSKNKKMTFGSHSISHRQMTELSTDEKEYELLYSKQFIEGQIKNTIDYFSLPYGVWNNRIVEISKKVGYKAIFTTNVQINYPELNPFIIHRWSPNSNTSIDLFEKMITFNPFVLERKIWSSKIKKISKKVLGKTLTDKLNLMYH